MCFYPNSEHCQGFVLVAAGTRWPREMVHTEICQAGWSLSSWGKLRGLWELGLTCAWVRIKSPGAPVSWEWGTSMPFLPAPYLMPDHMGGTRQGWLRGRFVAGLTHRVVDTEICSDPRFLLDSHLWQTYMTGLTVWLEELELGPEWLKQSNRNSNFSSESEFQVRNSCSVFWIYVVFEIASGTNLAATLVGLKRSANMKINLRQ